MSARTRRLELRRAAQQHRDDHALALLVRGLSYDEIGRQLAEVFDMERVPTGSTVWTMVRRALERRAVDEETVEQARTLAVMQLNALISAWMPRALGLAPDPNDPSVTLPADLKAATEVGRWVEKRGLLLGAGGPRVVINNTNNTVIVPGNADQLRSAIQEQLASEAEKMTVIQGELAGAGTSLADRLAGADLDDDQLPPPVPPKEPA